MNTNDLSYQQLEQEYKQILPLIAPYLPVFVEMKKREVINLILSSSDVKATMEHKNVYSYLDKLINTVDSDLEGE